MYYKRIIINIILLLSVLQAGAQQLSERYNANRPLVVACDWDKPPYEFRDGNGNPAGSNIDVLNRIARQLGITVQFVMKDWKQAINMFERGDADLIFANINRFNKEPYVATQIINLNRIRVAMTKDTTGIISLKTLEQKGVVLKSGDYSMMYFLDLDSANIGKVDYQSPKVALMGLITGDNQYFVWGEEPLKWKIKELNLEGIFLNNVGIPTSEVHIIGRDRELIDQIDDAYSRLKQSGELEQMLNKWFHPERAKQDMSPIAIYIVLGVVVLGLLMFFFNRMAKNHVKRVTRNSRELNEMMYKALRMGNFDVMEYDIAHDRLTNRYGSILPETGLTLKEFADRIHPEQRQEFMEKTKLMLAGRERQFELNKRWNAGTAEQPHWLNFQGHAICEYDHDGRPAYIVNAIHDVTHEVEEDKVSRELVKKYEKLSNMPSVALSFYDHNGWLMDLNDSMKKLCGMDKSPETRRFWEKVCMFDVPLFKNAYSPNERRELLVCQHMDYPEMNINNYIEIHLQPLCDADGSITNYFVNTIDITEEHNRAHNMHEQERQYGKVSEETVQTKSMLTFLLESTARYIWKSNVMKNEISFYQQHDQPETTMPLDKLVGYMAAEDRTRTREAIQTPDVLRRPMLNDIYHFHHTPSNPEETWMSICGNPYYDEHHNVVGHTGVAIDVTATMMAKRRYDEEVKRAEDSGRLKSGFMASMTHELRTPLNSIVGFSSVLEGVGESEERSEYVHIIRNNSDMLDRLINDIIEASSINDAAATVVLTDVDFSSAFDDICLTLSQRVQDAGITFVKDNPYDSFPARLDIGRVQQILTNFVTNAVKFTRKGHIRLGYRHEQEGLYIYCEDTGIGIPREKQEVIFERFVKLDEFVQGTGMGLAICKSIAEHCGGRIGVVSDGRDRGSTFWVWIPLSIER